MEHVASEIKGTNTLTVARILWCLNIELDNVRRTGEMSHYLKLLEKHHKEGTAGSLVAVEETNQ